MKLTFIVTNIDVIRAGRGIGLELSHERAGNLLADFTDILDKQIREEVIKLLTIQLKELKHDRNST